MGAGHLLQRRIVNQVELMDERHRLRARGLRVRGEVPKSGSVNRMMWSTPAWVSW